MARRLWSGVAAVDRALLAGLLPVVGLFAWLSQDPWRVERLYAHGVGPTVALALGTLTAWSPVGLMEWVEASAALVALSWLVLQARRVWRAPDPVPAAAGSASRAITALLVVGVWFYGAWGLSYARPAASERLGFDTLVRVNEADPALTLAELEAQSAAWVEVANHRYLNANGRVDLGVPSEHPGGVDAIDAALERGYAVLAEQYGLGDSVAWRRPPARPVIASAVMSFAGIGGVYFPFTGEANYNAHQPRWQQPFTIAHEKAHQRMIASEDEANFFGFLACMSSDDPYLMYAGALWAQRNLLITLQRYDRRAASTLIRRRYPGVQRDVIEGRRFWDGYQGPVMDLGHRVNDAYLKLNRVPGGVDSYARATRLLLLWGRARDGEVWPPDRPWQVGPGAGHGPYVEPSWPWVGLPTPRPSSAPQ